MHELGLDALGLGSLGLQPVLQLVHLLVLGLHHLGMVIGLLLLQGGGLDERLKTKKNMKPK